MEWRHATRHGRTRRGRYAYVELVGCDRRDLQPYGQGFGCVRDDGAVRHRRGDIATHVRAAQSRCGDSGELSDAGDRHARRQIRRQRIWRGDLLDPVEGCAGDRGPGAGTVLNYSSQGSYGQLGVGFSLGGLSGHHALQDDDRAGQDDPEHQLRQLDDERSLVPRWTAPCPGLEPCCRGIRPVCGLCAGNGTSRQEWRTELETYSKIESYSSTVPEMLGAPYHWRVTTKAGQILDFGSRWWVVSNGASQQSNTPGVDARHRREAYLLDRVTDRAGNYMEIDYTDRAIVANPTNDPHGRVFPMHFPCAPAARASPVLSRPIGAFPEVEYWVSKFRYYAAGTRCADPHGAVVFEFEDMPGQAPGPGTITRDRYYDSGAGQSAISVRLRSVRMLADTTNDANGALARTLQRCVSVQSAVGTPARGVGAGMRLGQRLPAADDLQLGRGSVERDGQAIRRHRPAGGSVAVFAAQRSAVDRVGGRLERRRTQRPHRVGTLRPRKQQLPV